jgi:hypothetical protein
MSQRVRLDDFNDIPDMTIGYDVLQPFNGDHAEPDSWTPLNLNQLADKPPVQPTLGGLGIVYPGKRHVFSGPQESAKTLAAYAIVIETVRTGQTCIIIDFEMGRWDARDRLRDLGATPDELNWIHYIEPAQPATTARIATLAALEPVLVVIDAAAGAYDIQGLDDNKRSDVEKFTRIYVHAFWQAEIATIVLDHVVKNLEGRGSYAIGSERKVGGTDVHLGFHPVLPIKRGSSGIYKITTHKDRGGYLQRGRLADLHLTSDPDTHAITWEFKEVDHTDEPLRPTVLMHRVSQWLQGEDEPASFSKIKSSVTGEDRFIAIATEYLIKEGYATEKPGPRDARLVTHETLFTDQPAPTPATPASTPAPQTSTTPAAASIAAGDEGVTKTTTPADDIDVYDPEVQARLDGPDIPF